MNWWRKGGILTKVFFQQWAEDDEAATCEAIAITNMVEFADRPLDTLSGGQKQRAWIAMTLAQNTPILLLDEPTTYLDIGYQLEVMELIPKNWSKSPGTVSMPM